LRSAGNAEHLLGDGAGPVEGDGHQRSTPQAARKRASSKWGLSPSNSRASPRATWRTASASAVPSIASAITLAIATKCFLVMSSSSCLCLHTYDTPREPDRQVVHGAERPGHAAPSRPSP